MKQSVSEISVNKTQQTFKCCVLDYNNKMNNAQGILINCEENRKDIADKEYRKLKAVAFSPSTSEQ